MHTRKAHIGFDFDGVVCDSAWECYFIARKTFIKILNREPSIKFPLFLKYRHLVKDPNFFGSLLLVLEEGLCGEMPQNPNDFEIYAKKKSKLIENFSYEFFSVRESIQENNFDEWINYNRIYDLQSLKKIFSDNIIYIITHKDKQTVESILNYYQLDVNRIYGNGDFKEKGEIISLLMKTNKIETLFYIDDQPVELNSCKLAGAECFWAKWGYGKQYDNQYMAIDSLSHFIAVMSRVNE